MKSTQWLAYPRTSPYPQGSTSLGGFTSWRVSGQGSSLIISKSMHLLKLKPKVDLAELSMNSSRAIKSITRCVDSAYWKSPVRSSIACANAPMNTATPAWTPTPSARSRGFPLSYAPTRNVTKLCPYPVKSINTYLTSSRSSFSRTRTSSGWTQRKRKTGASDAYSSNILELANTPLNRSWSTIPSSTGSAHLVNMKSTWPKARRE